VESGQYELIDEQVSHPIFRYDNLKSWDRIHCGFTYAGSNLTDNQARVLFLRNRRIIAHLCKPLLTSPFLGLHATRGVNVH
jgi:hypothetical protein